MGASMSFQKKALIGALICIGANTLVSLALNVQKLAHQRMKADEDGHQETSNEGAPDVSSAPKRTTHISQHDDNGAYEVPDGPGHRTSRNGGRTADDDGEDHSGGGPSTRFLKSKLWWLGMSLMVLGEGGNFVSYGFAPASLVAPLGSVALLANVFIAPVLVKERFAKSDLVGVALASLGATAVVAASSFDGGNGELPGGGPAALWQAIQQTIFLVYAGVLAVVGATLAWLSSTSWGDRYILIDVGACAIFGGFTVLSTKGISSLLSQATGRHDLIDLLKSPLSYILIVILVSTALVQIAFLNRALQRFDARSVIPSQFVFFTISAISGSAVLFRDFERASAGRVAGFVAGCLITFAGVFVLTRRQGEDISDDSTDHHSAADDGRASTSIVIDQERQALLPVTPQKQQQQQRDRPAGPIPAMTTGSVPAYPVNPLASSSLPSTSHSSASAKTPRLSLVGGTAIGAGGYLLLATPSGGVAALKGGPVGRARPTTPVPARLTANARPAYGTLSTPDASDDTRSRSSRGVQMDASPSGGRRTAGFEACPSESAPPAKAERQPNSQPAQRDDLPAMPLNLPTQFTTPSYSATNAGNSAAESSFRSQLSGFRWAQGSTNDSRPTASQPAAEATGPGGGAGGYLPNWMSSYVPLRSSERSNEEEAFLSLSRWERFLGFLACLAGSGVCFFFSFLFLLSPIPKLRKFALSFSMGSLLFMVGFSVLSGPLAHLRHITSGPRLPFSAAYFGSLALTLYFALGPRTTLPTLLAGVVQVVALIAYLAAYFPGGTTTLRYGGSMAARGLGSLLPI
ncbi:unnamed protein product [Parajaminaea phylloscopi]